MPKDADFKGDSINESDGIKNSENGLFGSNGRSPFEISAENFGLI